VWDNYHNNIAKYSNYEHPRMIPEWEWAALIDDAKEKKHIKEGYLPPIAIQTLR